MRDAIEKVVQPGKADPPGPDLPYTNRAKKVLELAMSEARELNHSYVGTEHLLLGLLAERKGIGAQVLTYTGIDLQAVRTETMRLLGRVEVMQPPPTMAPAQGVRPSTLYIIEVLYADGRASRARFTSKTDAITFIESA